AIAPSCLLDLLGMSEYTIPEQERESYFKSFAVSGKNPSRQIIQTVDEIGLTNGDKGQIASSRLYANKNGEVPEDLIKNQKAYGLKIVTGKNIVQEGNKWINKVSHGKIPTIFRENLLK